jgi:hypothetical protein
MRWWPFGKRDSPPAEPAPLRGGRPRLKTYSAQTGYVWQYYFEGFRPVTEGWEYAFQATADRRTWQALSVIVESRTVQKWEAVRRPLTPSERHGIAKMSLFAAFDCYDPPQTMPRRIVPTFDQLERIAGELDL